MPYIFLFSMEIIVSILSNSVYNNMAINEIIERFLQRRLSRTIYIKYNYVIMSKNNPSEYFSITNYPEEWAKIYTSNDYQYIDPVIITALKEILPFSWDHNIKDNLNLNSFNIFSLSKNYEIEHGYTFVIHDHKNNLVSLSMSVNKNNVGIFEDYIKTNKEKIQMLLTTLHHKITCLYIENNNNQTIKHRLI